MNKENKHGTNNIKEFREMGLLAEVNRVFFHPLGLALEVVNEKDSTGEEKQIWAALGEQMTVKKRDNIERLKARLQSMNKDKEKGGQKEEEE